MTDLLEINHFVEFGEPQRGSFQDANELIDNDRESRCRMKKLYVKMSQIQLKQLPMHYVSEIGWKHPIYIDRSCRNMNVLVKRLDLKFGMLCFVMLCCVMTLMLEDGLAHLLKIANLSLACLTCLSKICFAT
jgi:hypothetical protein